MSNYAHLSVLLIRFRLSEETNEIERLTSLGIPEEQIYQATINDTITGGVTSDTDMVLLKLDECGSFNWRQLFDFLDTTFTLHVPVLMCYDRFQQSQDVSELTTSYSHTKLMASDDGLDHFEKSVYSLVNGSGIDWDSDIDENEDQMSANNNPKKSNEDLFSYLAHEVKTPLSAVIGYTKELLESNKLDDKTKRDLKKIYSNSYQVLHVMNSVMEFPDQFLNEKVDQLETVHIGEIVDEIVDWQTKELQNSLVKLKSYVDESLSEGVKGKEGSVRQILINLVNNAIDHTDVGNIDIISSPINYDDIDGIRQSADYVSLDMLAATNNSPLVKIEVKDEGKGIHPSSIGKIFNHGVSEKNDAQKTTQDINLESDGLQSSNLGIGLSVIQQLIEQLNGFLAVNSEPGKGSSFIVILPYEIISSDDYDGSINTSSEDESSKALYERISLEAKELGDEWFEEFQEAIEGLDLNHIIMLCDRKVDDKPALTEVFEAAVFKNFQYLVEVQSAFLLVDTDTSEKTSNKNSKSEISDSIKNTKNKIIPQRDAQKLINGKSRDDNISKKLEAI